EASGREAEQHVALPDLRPVEDVAPLDDADDAAGEVEVARPVEVGHLGRLAADERAPVLLARLREPADDLLGHGRLEHARREVVEEEEGAGAADGDVVDAVVDEVLADGVVPADADGHLQLRADAVDGGDEDGLVVGGLVEGEEPAEGADVGEDAGRERLADEALDAADGLLAGLDVYAGVSVRGGHGGRS